MRVLSLTHEAAPTGGGGAFEHRAAELGHELTVFETPVVGLPADPASFDAIMVFGGIAHPDQDAEHAWLADETAFIAAAIEHDIPLLGVCLGSQLIARASGSWIGPGEVGEVGWHEVGLTEAGVADPVVGAAFPSRFEAFQWHYYTWELPRGAELLASNGAARQAYRLGTRTWGVQFHPEVNELMLDHWFTMGASELPTSQEAIRDETAAKLPVWSAQGQRLVDAFLDAAGT